MGRRTQSEACPEDGAADAPLCASNVLYTLPVAQAHPTPSPARPNWGSSVHRFDVPAFYREVRRILRPGGALAVFGYMPRHIYFPGSSAAGENVQRPVGRLFFLF